MQNTKLSISNGPCARAAQRVLHTPKYPFSWSALSHCLRSKNYGMEKTLYYFVMFQANIILPRNVWFQIELVYGLNHLSKQLSTHIVIIKGVGKTI